MTIYVLNFSHVKFNRTYLISAPIVPYYYTQLIGDAKTPPTLLAATNFDGMAVIGAVPNTACAHYH